MFYGWTIGYIFNFIFKYMLSCWFSFSVKLEDDGEDLMRWILAVFIFGCLAVFDCLGEFKSAINQTMEVCQ